MFLVLVVVLMEVEEVGGGEDVFLVEVVVLVEVEEIGGGGGCVFGGGGGLGGG